jgi:hypothetical protein
LTTPQMRVRVPSERRRLRRCHSVMGRSGLTLRF